MRRPGQAAPHAAAVLIPVIARADEPTLLFTRRTEAWRGIAARSVFPADAASRAIFRRWKPRCAKPWKRPASLRPSSAWRAILPRYLTGTGFDIQPVVGVLAPGFALAPDPREVAEIFEVPLAFFLDPANRRQETAASMARPHRAAFYVFEPDGA